MSKIKLYHIYDDGCGHRYLIPKLEGEVYYNLGESKMKIKLGKIEDSEKITEKSTAIH